MGHVFSSGHSLAGYHFHLPTFLRACRLGVSGWFCFRICSWLALSLREAFGWLGRVWFPPSFGCDFPFPPSFVPSFLLLPSPRLDSCYGGLSEISSGTSVWSCFQSPDVTVPVIYYKSGLVIRHAPDPSEGGVISVSFLLS